MKHFIVVKFDPDVTALQKEAMLPAIRELFLHTLQIDGIHGVNVIPNCIDRENRYDLMIVIDMEKEALPLYDECEWHKQWKAEYGGRILKKTIFDGEF